MLSCSGLQTTLAPSRRQSTLQRWIVWHQGHHKQFTVARVGAAPQTKRHWQDLRKPYMCIFLFLLDLHMVPDDICVFQTFLESTYPSLLQLQRCSSARIQRASGGKNTEEYLSFHNHSTDWCDWSKVEELFSLGIRIHPTLPNAFGRIPFCLCHFHQPPEVLRDAPRLLMKHTWNKVEPRMHSSVSPPLLKEFLTLSQVFEGKLRQQQRRLL